MSLRPQDMKPQGGKAVVLGLVSYALAGVTGALGLLNWAMLRAAVLAFVGIGAIPSSAGRAVDTFAFVAFGMIWLSLVLYARHVYAQGAAAGKLRMRFARITGGQIALLFICHALQALLGAAAWGTLLPWLGGELAAALLLAFLSRSRS